MDDLRDHPFHVFMMGESYVSDSEKAWLAWCAEVEKLFGHSLDGNEATDGYSIDFANDCFANGDTPEAYVAEVYLNPIYKRRRS